MPHTLKQLAAEMDRLWWERQRLRFIEIAWHQYLDGDKVAMWLSLFEAAFIEHDN